jgi:hypothetical protein
MLSILFVFAVVAGAGLSLGRAMAHGRPDNGAAKMAQLAQSRPAALKSAATTVEKFKQQAIRAGRYRCCLHHPCDYCALHMGTCPCDEQLDSGKPVCNECKGGWYAGDGEAKGKTADQIKTFPRR